PRRATRQHRPPRPEATGRDETARAAAGRATTRLRTTPARGGGTRPRAWRDPREVRRSGRGTGASASTTLPRRRARRIPAPREARSASWARPGDAPPSSTGAERRPPSPWRAPRLRTPRPPIGPDRAPPAPLRPDRPRARAGPGFPRP